MPLSATLIDTLNELGASTQTNLNQGNETKPFAAPGDMNLRDGLDDGPTTKLFGRDDLQFSTAQLRALIDSVNNRLLLSMVGGDRLDITDSFAAVILTKQWSFKTNQQVPRLGDTIKSLLEKINEIKVL